MTSVFIRRESLDTDTHRGKMMWREKGRRWPSINPGERPGQIFPHSPQKEPTLLTLWSWTSRLQKRISPVLDPSSCLMYQSAIVVIMLCNKSPQNLWCITTSIYLYSCICWSPGFGCRLQVGFRSAPCISHPHWTIGLPGALSSHSDGRSTRGQSQPQKHISNLHSH